MLRLLHHSVFAVLIESLAEWALKCPVDLLARHICHSLLKTVAEHIVAIVSAVLTEIDFALAAVSWIS